MASVEAAIAAVESMTPEELAENDKALEAEWGHVQPEPEPEDEIILS